MKWRLLAIALISVNLFLAVRMVGLLLSGELVKHWLAVGLVTRVSGVLLGFSVIPTVLGLRTLCRRSSATIGGWSNAGGMAGLLALLISAVSALQAWGWFQALDRFEGGGVDRLSAWHAVRVSYAVFAVMVAVPTVGAIAWSAVVLRGAPQHRSR